MYVRRQSELVAREPHKTFSQVGLPVGPAYVFHELAFNAPSETLVATVLSRQAGEIWHIRLFLRAAGESAYREVPIGDETTFISDVVVCSETPDAFVNIRRWTQPDRKAADSLAIYRVALPLGTVQRLPAVFRRGGSPTNLFISDLLGPASNSKGLGVVVGETTEVADPPGGHRTDYYACSFDVETGEVEIIAELPATFA